MIRHRRRYVRQLLVALALSAVLSACGTAGHPGQFAVKSSPSPGSGASPGAGSTGPGGTGSTGPGGTGSTGPGDTATSTTVPSVDSQTVPVAEQMLQQAGLVAGTQQQESDLDVPAGDVISTDPANGSTEPAGTTVNLVVSTGPFQCPGCRIIQSSQPTYAVTGPRENYADRD